VTSIYWVTFNKLGVKWSQVQILSARPMFMQVRGYFRGLPLGSVSLLCPNVWR